MAEIVSVSWTETKNIIFWKKHTVAFSAANPRRLVLTNTTAVSYVFVVLLFL